MPKFSKHEIKNTYNEEVSFSYDTYYDYNNDYDEDNPEFDYYEDVPEDDRDGAYYEDMYLSVQDAIESQQEQNFEDFDDFEELTEANFDEYMTKVAPKVMIKHKDSAFIEKGNEIINLVKKAKQFRLNRQYEEAISICDDILKRDNIKQFKNHVINLKIATLGDMNSPEAYNLATKEMHPEYVKEDFIKTLLGLLGKRNIYPQNFLNKLYFCYPYVLEDYISMLGSDNPKKKRLLDFLEQKGHKISSPISSGDSDDIPF